MKDAGEKDGGRRGESERNKDRGGGERRDKQKVVFSSEWEVRERKKTGRGGE